MADLDAMQLRNMKIPDEQAESEHHTFMLTAERALSRRHRIARVGIIIYFVTFLASVLAMCSCPGFFAVMGGCSLISFVYGSRMQRILSLALLPVAIIGFFIQLDQELRLEERVQRTREIYAQRIRKQQREEQRMLTK